METFEGSVCDNCGGPVLATQEAEEDGALYCEACRTRLRMQAAEAAPTIVVPPCRTEAAPLGEVKAECESWERASDEDLHALLADLETQETMGRSLSEECLTRIAHRTRARLVIMDAEIGRFSKELADLKTDHAQLDLALDKAMADHERDTDMLEKQRDILAAKADQFQRDWMAAKYEFGEARNRIMSQRDILAAAIRHIVDDRSDSAWVYEATWKEIRQMAKTALCEAGMVEKEEAC